MLHVNSLFASWVVSDIFTNIKTCNTQHQRVLICFQESNQYPEKLIILLTEPGCIFSPELS
jgi:hypothetical protein